MSHTPIRPHFSLVRDAGRLVLVSGQMPLGPDGQAIVAGVAQQTRQCLLHIEAALAGQGLGLADVVKTTVWLARAEDFPAFNAAYAEAFDGLAAPARSTVRADLMVEGALVEMEAMACRQEAP